MKRRTIDASKFRRPIKRSRITDSVNSSWLLYLRSFIIWLLIITMDFSFEFRFEFLWSFWLLIRSLFDSFKYQGMGLTVLFLCITLFSDVVCFLLLPTHWLFFVASTYVWVQFICNTERGPCLATVCLWLLFVYVEASVRLREIKSVPFNLDLCRPFAAHCIGYPVVNLGYGLKSYLGYRIKNYQQCEVTKQNMFYHQLVSYALPAERNDELSQKNVMMLSNNVNSNKSDSDLDPRKRGGNKISNIDEKLKVSSLSLNDLEVFPSPPKDNKKTLDISADSSFTRVCNRTVIKACNGEIKRSKHKKPSVESENEYSDSEASSNGSNARSTLDISPRTNRPNVKSDSSNFKLYKEEQLLRRKAEAQASQLECELKKLRSEVHLTRISEVQSRTQINAGLKNERDLTSELDQLSFDNDLLQQKINSLNCLKSQEKLLICSLEKKLRIEKENHLNTENQLIELKKKNSNNIVEDHDNCKTKHQELENQLNKLKNSCIDMTASLDTLKKENDLLKQKSSDENGAKMRKDIDFLSGALNAMQGKNLHLEKSLSSETRLKLDLFSALGDARRQLEIVRNQLQVKCSEVDVLKAKIAEVMAVMPLQYQSQLNGLAGTYINESKDDIAVTSVGFIKPKQNWLDTNGAQQVAK